MTDRQGIAWTPGEREEHAAPPSRDETGHHRAGVVREPVIECEERRVGGEGGTAVESRRDVRPVDDGSVSPEEIELLVERVWVDPWRSDERRVGRVTDVMPHDRKEA